MIHRKKASSALVRVTLYSLLMGFCGIALAGVTGCNTAAGIGRDITAISEGTHAALVNQQTRD